MTTVVYANGVRSTAVAGIISEVQSRYTTGADGVKRLDVAGLAAWLQDQFLAIRSDSGLPSGADTSLGGAVDLAARAFNAGTAQTQVNALDAKIGPAAIQARPDYPDLSAGALNAGMVTAILNADAEIKRLQQEIEAYYLEAWRTDDQSMLVQALVTMFNQNQIDLRIPAAVQRIVEERAYIYTHVSGLGEESAPSPVSDVVELDQNDTVGLTLTKPATVDWGTGGTRDIVGVNVYRSLAGSDTAAFQLVPNPVRADGLWPVTHGANLSLTDDVATNALGETCPSSTWAEPPVVSGVYLSGMTGLPNGIIAGYIGSTVYFCEPYHPYAWPQDYRVALEYDVNALGVFNQTLVVSHAGGIDYISGADPSSMSRIKSVSLQVCASPRSMVTVDGAVVYASPDGLCVADQSGVKVVTGSMFSREDWQALTPTGMFAAEHDGIYYFWYAGSGGGCYALHLATGKLVKMTITATAARADKTTDTLYVASGTNVAPQFKSGRASGLWRSRIQVQPKQAGFAWINALSDWSSPVVVRLYADGALWHTSTLTSSTPTRLPPGRPKEIEMEVETTARVTEVTIASSTAELKAS